AGTRCPPRDLTAWLAAGGYVRTEAIENPGEFAVRGGVMDVFPPGGALPVRLDFFGDEVERIFEVDLATHASDRKVDAVQLVAASVDPAVLETAVPVGTVLDPRTVRTLAPGTCSARSSQARASSPSESQHSQHACDDAIAPRSRKAAATSSSKAGRFSTGTGTTRAEALAALNPLTSTTAWQRTPTALMTSCGETMPVASATRSQ
ncbi:MAG: hypothetical protein ACKOHI_12695, partial [Phycisphaerales bacterium]